MERLALWGPALFDHPLSAAVIEVVAERGYQEASIEEIVARADVAPEEFDRLFAGKADAVLQVFEAYIDNFKRRAGGAYDSAGRWPDSLRAAAHELLAWIEDHPHAYRFGMVEVLSAGEMARVRREELFTWCAGLIDAGREVAPDPDAVPEAAALAAIGAVVETLTFHAAGRVDASLTELGPELMYWAVRPYLGDEVARAELTRPPPPLRT
jgi:AcrR family transcriptional regulator